MSQKEAIRLNVDNPKHADFLFSLAMACRDYFFNDYENDIILIIEDAKRKIASGQYAAFLCKVDNKPIGIVWVEKDQYDIGYIRAGIMPEYRNGIFAKYFLRQFVDFCFDSLKLRKLVATFTKEQRAIERLLRDLKFTKEGYLRKELIVNGKPVDLLRLALESDTYEATK